MTRKRVDQKAFASNFVAQSFDIGPGHRDAKRKSKIHKKGTSTTNKYEKETFLKHTGPQLPGV